MDFTVIFEMEVNDDEVNENVKLKDGMKILKIIDPPPKHNFNNNKPKTRRRRNNNDINYGY